MPQFSNLCLTVKWFLSKTDATPRNKSRKTIQRMTRGKSKKRLDLQVSPLPRRWNSLATSLEHPAQTTEMVISHTIQSKKLFAFYSATKYINQRISCKLLEPQKNKKPSNMVPKKQQPGSIKGQNISSSS